MKVYIKPACIIKLAEMNNAHTFVIPAYGASPYLEACIKSLKTQTVTCIIMITTSTPSAYLEEIAGRYGLAYYIDPYHQGIAADWNFALAKATTPLVTIAHQDDIYEPAYAESIINQLQPYNNVLIAFTNYRDIVNDKITTGGLNGFVKRTMLLPFAFSRRMDSRFFKQLILRFGDPVCCPSVTFNKPNLGNFKFSEDYEVALDWLAWYQLSLQQGAFLYINQPLVQHRIHAQSATTLQINNGLRRLEERQLLQLIWGKTVGSLIARVYALGQRSNLKA